MSGPQIRICASRIRRNTDRAEFLRLMDEARALFTRAAALRRMAWKLYYDSTGLRPRAEQEMFR